MTKTLTAEEALDDILDVGYTLIPTDPAPTHRHLKTGGLYRLISDQATIEATMTPAVVYEGSDGKLWVRPKSEFFDGRVEPLKSSEPPK